MMTLSKQLKESQHPIASGNRLGFRLVDQEHFINLIVTTSTFSSVFVHAFVDCQQIFIFFVSFFLFMVVMMMVFTVS